MTQNLRGMYLEPCFRWQCDELTQFWKHTPSCHNYFPHSLHSNQTLEINREWNPVEVNLPSTSSLWKKKTKNRRGGQEGSTMWVTYTHTHTHRKFCWISLLFQSGNGGSPEQRTNTQFELLLFRVCSPPSLDTQGFIVQENHLHLHLMAFPAGSKPSRVILANDDQQAASWQSSLNELR